MALAMADISVDTAMMLTPIPISHTHLLTMCPTCGIFILWGRHYERLCIFFLPLSGMEEVSPIIDKRILIDGGLCEECHERAGYIVHHRTLLTPANISDPEVSLNHANLEFVCKKCHDNFEGHFYQKSPKKLTKCEFDAFGMPVPPSNLD